MPDLQSSLAVDETIDTTWTVPQSFAAFDADTLTELVEMYLEDTKESVRRLRDTFEAGDAKGVSRLAHTLKGSSRNFHVALMSKACEAIETLSRDGRMEPVDGLLHVLEDGFPKVAASMRQVIGR